MIAKKRRRVKGRQDYSLDKKQRLGSMIMVPKPQTKKNRRFPERKSVTIGFGCLCEDGVLLAADTQLTAAGYHKSYARKIEELHGDGFVDAAVTYAGSPVFASDFGDSLLEKILETSKPIEPSSFKPMISSVLGRYVESDVNSNHMLIGIKSTDGGMLFRTSGYSVSYCGTGEPAFVGAGDSSALALALPLMSRLGVTSMHHAALIAFVLVEIAKKYIDGCGGETDILMMPWDGRMEFLGQDVLGNIWNCLSETDTVLANAVSRVFLPSTDAERDEVIDRLAEEIKLTGRLLEQTFTRQDPQKSKDSQ